MVALMKRLSLSAEDKERSAAVTEIVDLVKKGGVAALKVCTLYLSFFIVLHHKLCLPGSACCLLVYTTCFEDCRQTDDGL